MTPAQLSRAIRHTLPRVLPGEGADDLRGRTRVVVESPPRRGDGDYATGVAFQAAAACGRPAREVAEALAARLVRDEEAIAAAEVVGAGFVNVTLTSAGRIALLRTLAESGPDGALAESASVGHASAEPAFVGHRSAEPAAVAAVGAVGAVGALAGSVSAGARPGPAVVGHEAAEPASGGTFAEPAVAGRATVESASAGHVATEACMVGAPAEAAPPVETLAPPAHPGPPAPREAPPLPTPTDHPAHDIARWARVTGEDPKQLAVRTERCSSLFRVQYAHARICALLRNGRWLGLWPEPASAVPLGAAGARLLALLADRARITAPGPLARHLDAVAGAFAVFHDVCEPLPRGEEKPGAVHRGRLALAEATGAVLAGGLSQLGVTAPAHL
ncbi:DALR anticodon-binding domain-containing protein [Streptomyces sp. NPDC053499]|uniref:DALR anticodon-binding domain-containing protein n=1 Tax=Streptomyces sp. NPDC053499 TaxID=3365707 RepID=UPI0037D92304